ncbi:MAG: DUF92 domain-containing protein [Thermoanaerobaculia bacterium]|nr:DUF92 domain-containing protein [Thermoanaerobaculia bacterium]
MHESNEGLRKSLHIAFGLFAFSLKWLPWWVAACVAVSAVLGNWLVLHRVVGRSVARHERGFDAGIVIYPAMVLLLVVVFREQLHIAAIAWTTLAFGDGFATLAGKAAGIARLPWNRDKSLGGLLTFVIAGSIAGIAVVRFLGAGSIAAVVIAVVVAAIVESLPLRVDDNLTVPIAAVVVLVIAELPAVPYSLPPHSLTWLAINTLLAIAGWFARSVDLSGAIGGWVLGAILILGAGFPLYVALLAFFVIGTLTTKIGYARKARLGLAQERGGRRGFSHAFSNVGIAAICAIAVARLGHAAEAALLPVMMGLGSLATAAADTTASEIGQLAGRRAFLPLTLKRVPVGTEGAVSLEGTLAGLIAGFIVAAISLGTMRALGARGLIILTAAAFLGSYLESIAGSWNRKQSDPVPNGVLNFFNTAAGALLVLIAWQIRI